MIDLGKVGFVLMCLGFAGMLALNTFLVHQNYTLTSTNAQLVDLLDTQLSATEARMRLLEEVQAVSIEWLISDGPVAYAEFIARETDDK